MVHVTWKGNLTFEGTSQYGDSFLMDAPPDDESQRSLGPTPFEAFQASLAACSAIDVLMILNKKRQIVTEYRVEVDGERPEPGKFPRPFTSMVVRHYLKGKNLDPGAVERAVQLSDEKYCSVAATLRANPKVSAEWIIEE